MSGMLNLSKRNIKMYLRDYVSVFFSVLSMLIVLALMVIFLGKMNCENVVDALAQFGGVRDAAVDEKNAAYLISRDFGGECSHDHADSHGNNGAG